MDGFDEFFHKAVGNAAYGYQRDLALRDEPPTILRVPTGCGKTAAAVLAWLWRRQQPGTRDKTPRRLVYCLPMRTLVDQVKESVDEWVGRLDLRDSVDVVVLMGGNADREWSRRPERDAILIGTQDLLLSRALNRGYALSPAAWPVEFGLLNNDCFWVVDEVQLMSNGLPTSLQLESMRRKCGTFGKCGTMWMSATVRKEDLATADFGMDGHDVVDSAEPNRKITKAVKHLRALRGLAAKGDSYSASDAKKIFECHGGKTTLVIVNRVGRAQSLYLSVKKLAGDKTKVMLIHSRFRPSERRRLNKDLADAAKDPNRDLVIISTQAIEAGVDISSHTMITELAPVTSMIQRFGRCNRRAEHKDGARIFWIDADKSDAAPYEQGEIDKSRRWLAGLPAARGGAASVGAGHPGSVGAESGEVFSASPEDLKYDAQVKPHDAVIRRADLLALFDTAPDLSGSYLDVSRFVRHGNANTDVFVYWRELPKGGPTGRDMARHTGDEVCAVPIGAFKKFLQDRRSGVWHYEHAGEDYSDSPWVRVTAKDVRPGQVFLADTNVGGYSDDLGWFPDTEKSRGTPVPKKAEWDGSGTWVTLHDHSKNVLSAAKEITKAVDLDCRWANSVQRAALFHDVGKSHYVFQNTLVGCRNKCWKGEWAKSPGRGHIHERKNFRHEVASALAYLKVYGKDLDSHLVAYLIASHHGKVRMSLRSSASRLADPPDGRYLLGFSTDPSRPDKIPEHRLGDGTPFPSTTIEMGAASIGLQEDGSPSWLSMAVGLRDEKDIGPFRLAYLESLVRAADVRASAEEDAKGKGEC